MKRNAVWYAVIVVLSLLALSSIGRAVDYAFFGPNGGIDLHPYWYSGIFIRQKTDPYAAYLSSQQPATPVFFLGSATGSDLSEGRSLSVTPANTAPLMLLISPLAWMPWTAAKLLWFAVNLALAALIPWLVTRLLPPPRLPLSILAVIYLAYFALKSTRMALAAGQTTLVVFALMILSLLIWKRSWIGAGFLLGIAMSKYSIALPLVLYFLYKRQWKTVAVGMGVQLVAVLALSSIGGSSPLAIIRAYFQIMLVHVEMPGVHLAALFDGDSPLRRVAPLVLTAIVFAFLMFLFVQHRQHRLTSARQQFGDFQLFTLLCLWTLLVAYHRPYDATQMILFMVMVAYGLCQPSYWQLARLQQAGLLLLAALTIAWLMAPYEQIASLIPGDQYGILVDRLERGVPVALTAILATIMLLLYRTCMIAPPVVNSPSPR